MPKFKRSKTLDLAGLSSDGRVVVRMPGDEIKLRTHPITKEVAPALYRDGRFAGWFGGLEVAHSFGKAGGVRVLISNPPEKES